MTHTAQTRFNVDAGHGQFPLQQGRFVGIRLVGSTLPRWFSAFDTTELRNRFHKSAARRWTCLGATGSLFLTATFDADAFEASKKTQVPTAPNSRNTQVRVRATPCPRTHAAQGRRRHGRRSPALCSDLGRRRRPFPAYLGKNNASPKA